MPCPLCVLKRASAHEDFPKAEVTKLFGQLKISGNPSFSEFVLVPFRAMV